MIQYDALNVHLAVPRLYLQQGAVVDLPYFFHSYFAHLLNVIFGLCLAVGGPLVAKFLVLGLGVLAAAGVFVAGRALFSDEVGLWASVIFYTTPMVVWLSSTAYLDLPLALFIVASVVAFIRWHESADSGWLAASGWIAGVAIGTKVAALTALILLPIFAVWHRPRVRLLAVYLLPLLIVTVPWFLVVYVHTGNPLFPLMNAVFRSPQWPLENTSFNAQTFGIGTSAAALLRLPFDFTFNSSLFGEVLPRGSTGVALLLAFPLALVFAFRGRPIQRCVLALIGLHVTIWTLTFQYGRYMMPALPFLAVMGCAVFLSESSGLGRWNRVLLFCCVLAQVSILSVAFWNIPERFPLQRALGVESEESFLERSLPLYRAARFLNGVLQPGEKILGLNVENMRFYLNAPLYTQTEIDMERSPYELSKVESNKELDAWLMRFRFTYLLVLQTDLRNSWLTYPYLRPDFLERFGRQLYSDEHAAVFRIEPFEVPASRVPRQPLAQGDYDDGDARLVYHDRWDRSNTFPETSGSSISYSNVRGAAVEFSFVGTEMTYVYTRANNRGKASVSIDGVDVGVIDLYGPETNWQTRKTWNGLTQGVHEVQIRVLKEKSLASQNFYVDVDAIYVR